MKMNPYKSFVVACTYEEENALTSAITTIDDIITQAKAKHCDTFWGKKGEQTYTVNIDDLKEIIDTLANFLEVTEMT